MICKLIQPIRRRLRGKIKCYGCNERLTVSNNSEAHVIPNALGGRLAPKNIICKSCNGKLDKLADNNLVKAFHAWPTLLQIPRQRFRHASFKTDTDNGNQVKINSDASLQKLGVEYEKTEIEGGHKLHLSASNEKTLVQLIQRARKDFPQLNAYSDEEIKEHFRIGQLPDDERIKVSIDMYPEAIFGGCATALWLFMIHKTKHAPMNWEGLLNYIHYCKIGNNLRYYTEGLPGLVGPDIQLGHKLVLRSIPETGELVAYIEILNILKVGCIFAKSPKKGTSIEHIYAYDLSLKKDRSDEFSIDDEAFKIQPWKTVGLHCSDTELVMDYMAVELQKLNDYYQNMPST